LGDTNHASVVGRELNRRRIVIGTLSYGYILAAAVSNFNSNIPALNFPPMNPVLALACVLGCACLSYNLVEQPGLWLRDKLNKAWAIRAASVS
jgi:peptidoglycan/LPS O-acetylase OafA/YrhL